MSDLCLMCSMKSRKITIGAEGDAILTMVVSNFKLSSIQHSVLRGIAIGCDKTEVDVIKNIVESSSVLGQDAEICHMMDVTMEWSVVTVCYCWVAPMECYKSIRNKDLNKLSNQIERCVKDYLV